MPWPCMYWDMWSFPPIHRRFPITSEINNKIDLKINITKSYEDAEKWRIFSQRFETFQSRKLLVEMIDNQSGFSEAMS